MLQEGRLLYFRSPEQAKPINYIPLEQAIISVCKDEGGASNCFEVITKSRTYMLSAKTRKDMSEWMSVMSQLTSLHQENELMEQAEDMICEFAYERATKSLKMLSKARELPGASGGTPLSSSLSSSSSIATTGRSLAIGSALAMSPPTTSAAVGSSSVAMLASLTSPKQYGADETSDDEADEAYARLARDADALLPPNIVAAVQQPGPLTAVGVSPP
mgnify:CR=1 FL=1